MYVIGLTGGIGSGKSTVSRILEEKGAVVLSADLLGHEVYLPGSAAWQDVVDTFGREIVAADGSIDRKKLGAIVFADESALRRLNGITHPRMKELMREKLAQQEAAGTRVVVLEAALLFDAGWDDLADEIWVTAAPAEIAARRTAERSGLSLDEALARVRSQMSNEERLRRSDLFIDTDCPLAETHRQVDEAWARLAARLEPAGSPPGRSGV